MIRSCLIGLCVLLPVWTQAAVLKSTVTGGNWRDASTWQQGVVPQQGDGVIIQGPVRTYHSRTVDLMSVREQGRLELVNDSTVLKIEGELLNLGNIFGQGQLYLHGGFRGQKTDSVIHWHADNGRFQPLGVVNHLVLHSDIYVNEDTYVNRIDSGEYVVHAIGSPTISVNRSYPLRVRGACEIEVQGQAQYNRIDAPDCVANLNQDGYAHTNITAKQVHFTKKGGRYNIYSGLTINADSVHIPKEVEVYSNTGRYGAAVGNLNISGDLFVDGTVGLRSSLQVDGNIFGKATYDHNPYSWWQNGSHHMTWPADDQPGVKYEYFLSPHPAQFSSSVPYETLENKSIDIRNILRSGREYYFTYRAVYPSLVGATRYSPWSKIRQINTIQGVNDIPGQKNLFSFNIMKDIGVGDSLPVTLHGPSDYSGRMILSAKWGEVYPREVHVENGYWAGQVEMFDVGTNQRLFASGVANLKGIGAVSNQFQIIANHDSVGTLRVTLRRADGSVVPNTLVYINNMRGQTYDSVTDQYGVVVKDVPAGLYEMSSSDYGLKTTIEVPVDDTAHAEMVHQGPCNHDGKTPVLLVPGIQGSDVIEQTGWFPRLTRHVPLWNEGVLELHNPKFPFFARDVAGWRAVSSALRAKGFQQNCTLFEVPYDWSLAVPDIADQFLKPWIDHAKRVASTPQVDIVAHSMGGLVARAYIQSKEYQSDVRKLAMVGTPNQGSAMSYFAWEGGDPWSADKINNSLKSTLAGAKNFQSRTTELNYQIKTGTDKKVCQRSIWDQGLRIVGCDSAVIKRFLHEHSPSAGNLYPTYDFLYAENQQGQYEPVKPVFNNTFLRNLNSTQIATSVDVQLFVGQGHDTVNNIYVDPKQKGATLYTDGKILSTSAVDGDGTVIRYSLMDQIHSLAPNKSGEHISLVKRYVEEIVNFLVE